MSSRHNDTNSPEGAEAAAAAAAANTLSASKNRGVSFSSASSSSLASPAAHQPASHADKSPHSLHLRSVWLPSVPSCSSSTACPESSVSGCLGGPPGSIQLPPLPSTTPSAPPPGFFNSNTYPCNSRRGSQSSHPGSAYPTSTPTAAATNSPTTLPRISEVSRRFSTDHPIQFSSINAASSLSGSLASVRNEGDLALDPRSKAQHQQGRNSELNDSAPTLFSKPPPPAQYASRAASGSGPGPASDRSSGGDGENVGSGSDVAASSSSPHQKSDAIVTNPSSSSLSRDERTNDSTSSGPRQALNSNASMSDFKHFSQNGSGSAGPDVGDHVNNGSNNTGSNGDDDGTENGNPSSGKNRIRVAKACDRCKRRKTKCDGRYPCVACEKTKSECIYTPSSFAKSTIKQSLPQSPASPQDFVARHPEPRIPRPNSPHHLHAPDTSTPLLSNSNLDPLNGTDAANGYHINGRKRRNSSISEYHDASETSPLAYFAQQSATAATPQPRHQTGMLVDTRQLESRLSSLSSQLATLTNAISSVSEDINHKNKPTDKDSTERLVRIFDISQMMSTIQSESPAYPSLHFSKMRFTRRYVNFFPHQFGLNLFNSISERAREKFSVPRVQQYGWNMSGSHFLKARTIHPGTELVDEETTRYLLKYFFQNINPLFSIIHEPMFMKQYEAYLLTEDKRECRLFMAILNITRAIAMRFSETAEGKVYEKDLEEKLFDDGHSTMQAFSFEWESTEIVQGWLLIAFYVRACYRQPAAWSALGQANRLVIGMGLHKKTSFEIYLNEYGILKRKSAFWPCYVLDRCFSVDVGRSFSFFEDQISFPIPTSYSDNGWQSLLTYSLIKLCNTIQGICYDSDFTFPQSKVREVSKRLLDWNESMKEFNLADDRKIGDTPYPIGMVAHMRLTYYCFTCFIYMRSIFTLIDQGINDDYPDVKILTDAIIGINVVTDMLEQEKQLLTPWWHTLSGLFSAGCLCLLFISNNISILVMTAELGKVIRKITLIADAGRFVMAKECLWSLKTLNHMLLTRMRESQQKLAKIGIDHGESTVNNMRFFDMGSLDKDGNQKTPVVEVPKPNESPTNLPQGPANTGFQHGNPVMDVTAGMPSPFRPINVPASSPAVVSLGSTPAESMALRLDPGAPAPLSNPPSDASMSMREVPGDAGGPFVDPVVSLDWFSNWTWEFESSLASYLEGNEAFQTKPGERA